MRRITDIVIHCTAGYGDVAAIKRFWFAPKSKGGLGWRSVGYHFFIYQDGRVEKLAPLSTITNGVKNHNMTSVHIAYQGGVERGNVNKAKDTRTPAQKQAILRTIKEVVTELKKHQDVSQLKIRGHRDFSPDKNGNGIIESWERIKECPSFDAIPEYSGYLKTVLSVLFAVILISLNGCKTASETTERHHTDETTITNTVVERDTMIVTARDTVSMILDCPTPAVRIEKGEYIARLVSRPVGMKTIVDCECDSSAIIAKLRDSLKVRERVITDTVVKTKTVYKNTPLTQRMAAIGWLFIVLIAAVLIFQIIKILK